MKRWILLLVATLSVSSCDFLVCREKQILEAKSPDGKYIAVMVARNCAPDNTPMYHIYLQGKGGWIIPSLFGTIKGDEVIIAGKRKVNPLWKGEKTLLIECDDCPADYYPKILQRSWKDVSISYQSSQRSD